MAKFNINLGDSQATEVVPVKSKDFDYDRYSDYATELNDRCEQSWNTRNYYIVFSIAASVYLLCWLSLKIFVRKRKIQFSNLQE